MCVEEKTEVPIFISRWTIDLAREGMKDVAGILGQEAGAVTDAHGTPHGALSGVRHGGAGGLTAVTTADGRFTAMMPHPERVFRNVQMSWTSGDVTQPSPWLRMFRNARKWVG